MEKENFEIIKLLLTNDKYNNLTYKKEAKYNLSEKSTRITVMTQLIYAIDHKQDTIIQFLLSDEFSALSDKIGLNERTRCEDHDFHGKENEILEATPLYWAIHKQNISAIKLLLAKNDIDIYKTNFRSLHGSPLKEVSIWQKAAEIGNPIIINILLENKESKKE